MMTAFWIGVALMLAIALAFVLPGLLRGSTPNVSGAAVEARRRLSTLEAAHRDGHLSDEEYATRKADIAGSLLDAVEPPAGTPRSLATGLIVLVAAPVFAVVMYYQVGNPDAIGATDRPVAATSSGTGNGEGALDLTVAVTQLRQRLTENPEDVDGWFLLGRSYRSMERFSEAADAYSTALELAPDQPVILVEYAEALAFQSGAPTLPEEAREALRKAMEQDPTLQKGLWLQGQDAFNLGNYEVALTRWQALASQLEAGTPGAQQIAQQIGLAREALGLDPEAAPSAPAPTVAGTTGPTDGPVSSDPGAGLTVEVSLDPRLNSQVTPGDTLFVFARAHNGPPMPLAIARLTAGDLPTSVRLTADMAMMPAMNLSAFPQVVVGARISKTGNASAQPGDLEALSEPVSNAESQPIRLEISTVL